jgi:D-serine deaminase-like pyridoxal phosphate-dependent protein
MERTVPVSELAPGTPGTPTVPTGLDTPCVVVDMDVVRSNIQSMQRAMDVRGVALRPHAKTHKSVPVARMQLEAGAIGLTVGTLGEAEVFAEAGVEDLFVAYPVWLSGSKADRLRRIMDRTRLTVGVESADGAVRLGDALRGADPLRVLVEIDSGEHRTGVQPAEAVEVAAAAQRAGLRVAGVFTHGGHSYAEPGGADRAAGDEVDALELAAKSLHDAGFVVETVSAGSTPTAVRSARSIITEERPGTYVFGDRQQIELGVVTPGAIGLFVAATVVSSRGGHVVLDAGAKSLSKDRKPWMTGYGVVPAYPGLVLHELYDYHGVGQVEPGGAAPVVGERVAVIPNHVCPVVNLVDNLEVVQAGSVVGRWDVDARGRSS